MPAAGIPGIGDPVPDFALPNQYGETVRSEDLAGAPAVLVFYPFAFSRVCSGELEVLAGLQPEFSAAGARLLAVSCDAKYSLRAWAAERGWGFDLLSDFWPHGAAAKAFGVFEESRGMAGRSSFIAGADGLITRILRSGPDEPRRAGDYLQALSALSAGERN
ncbi:redoxin domain-containing protein [Arthrobacter gandavensis]|uniref:redoxin domain-containing protein n=1 Tax=Arthrobacter gandavensis TaxID=169960 RepID=UPI00188E8786|nr:redoxin domain-containing protein [Arthrobacter gandavensis]MBF4995462.1 redoxin domain-containing protein [Arthrobacter gandavensis]